MNVDTQDEFQAVVVDFEVVPDVTAEVAMECGTTEFQLVAQDVVQAVVVDWLCGTMEFQLVAHEVFQVVVVD